MFETFPWCVIWGRCSTVWTEKAPYVPRKLKKIRREENKFGKTLYEGHVYNAVQAHS